MTDNPLFKLGASLNNITNTGSIAGNIAGAALDIASSLGGSVASGSNKLEHLFTIPNEESSYNSFMPDIEAAIQSSIDEVLQGLDDMAAQAEWDDLLRHPARATRSITDTYYRMKNSQIAERQARQQSGAAGYKNIILKNPVDPQRYREIVKSALENRAEVRWNNRINSDVRNYKLENLDLAHPMVSWLRDNTSDQNSEILRMYSVDALKRLALPDERRTEIDAHYFNEDVEVVKALNNIEAYAKEAQQQIEANMAELKELLARQAAASSPFLSPVANLATVDLSGAGNMVMGLTNNQKPDNKSIWEKLFNMATNKKKPSNNKVVKELVVKLDDGDNPIDKLLINSVANKNKMDSNKVIFTPSKEKLDEELSKYDYIENLKLVGHSVYYDNKASLLSFKEKEHYIGYTIEKAYRNGFQETVIKSMPPKLDKMLKEQKIKNLFLVGCRTAGSLLGKEEIKNKKPLIFRCGVMDKYTFESINNEVTEEISLAKFVSQAYPGVYVFGNLSPQNTELVRSNYVRFYTDPAAPLKTYVTYWQY